MNSSFFNLNLNLTKSHGIYAYDKIREREFIDLHGHYSSLPLGYNHAVFKSEDFKNDILRVAGTKVALCEYLTDDAKEFEAEFMQTAGKDFQNVHFCATGGLAVEMAIKAAFEYKNRKRPGYSSNSAFEVITHENGFHGVTATGNIVTDRVGAVKSRLEGFPGEGLWSKFSSATDLEKSLSRNKNIVAILIEPVKCTQGDIYHSEYFFKTIREIADKLDVPLIFDEVQTGMSTGKMFYYQRAGIQPDIVCFGKKFQTAGILIKEKFDTIAKTPAKLCITFDGCLTDFIRCKYILREVTDNNLLKNSEEMAECLKYELKEHAKVKNVRGVGGLIAFDFDSRENRDNFVRTAFKNGLMCNPTSEITVRFRPHLAVTDKDVESILNVVKKSL